MSELILSNQFSSLEDAYKDGSHCGETQEPPMPTPSSAIKNSPESPLSAPAQLALSSAPMDWVAQFEDELLGVWELVKSSQQKKKKKKKKEKRGKKQVEEREWKAGTQDEVDHEDAASSVATQPCRQGSMSTAAEASLEETPLTSGGPSVADGAEKEDRTDLESYSDGVPIANAAQRSGDGTSKLQVGHLLTAQESIVAHDDSSHENPISECRMNGDRMRSPLQGAGAGGLGVHENPFSAFEEVEVERETETEPKRVKRKANKHNNRRGKKRGISAVDAAEESEVAKVVVPVVGVVVVTFSVVGASLLAMLFMIRT